MYEEESPGEPMKPLSEFAEGLRTEVEDGCLHDSPSRCFCVETTERHADELQAWLSGWHRELDKAEASQGPDPIGPLYGAAISASRNWIRTELLGTTQKPKQEGEK